MSKRSSSGLDSALAGMDLGSDDDFEVGADFGSAPSSGLFTDGAIGNENVYAPTATIQQPPIWHTTKGRDGNYSLRIERRDDAGHPQYLGTLAPDATRDDLVVRYKRSGTYLVTPMDEHGHVLADAFVIHIPEDNPILVRQRGQQQTMAAGGLGAAMMMGAGGGSAIPTEAWQFLTTAIHSKDAQLEAEQQARQSAAQEAREAHERAVQLQMAAATDFSARAMDVQREAMEAERERQAALFAKQQALEEQALERMRAASDLQATQVQQFYQAMSAQMQASLEAERMRMEREREREEDRAKRREEDERRWERERSQAREARLEREREAHERELERTRAHNAMQLELIGKLKDAENPINAVDKLLPQILGVTEALGIDLKQITGILGGGGPKGWIEVIGDTIEKGVDAFGKLQAQQAQIAMQQQLMMQQISPEEYEQLAMNPGQPAQSPGDAQLPAPAPVDEAQARAQAAFGYSAEPESIPVAQPVPEVSDVASTPAPDHGLPVPAELAALPPAVLKAARRTLRELVEHVRASGDPRATWAQLRGSGAFPAVGQFVQASSMIYALREGGASEQLAEAILSAVDSDLPAAIRRR